MSDARKTQVGGSHYTSMPFQPLEFAVANGWDPCAAKILKYLSRWPDKGGVEDVQKALHMVSLRASLQTTWGDIPPPRAKRVPIDVYCAVNASRFCTYTVGALHALEGWVYRESPGPDLWRKELEAYAGEIITGLTKKQVS